MDGWWEREERERESRVRMALVLLCKRKHIAHPPDFVIDAAMRLRWRGLTLIP